MLKLKTMRLYPKTRKSWPFEKELEEATALELPMMEQNLPIIGTITTLGTLMGLLGTVIGMIRSFAALSAGGGTDSMALSQGISEALNQYSIWYLDRCIGGYCL